MLRLVTKLWGEPLNHEKQADFYKKGVIAVNLSSAAKIKTFGLPLSTHGIRLWRQRYRY